MGVTRPALPFLQPPSPTPPTSSLASEHLRSQICEKCASARCFTDNLVLCQDCDWDPHVAFPVPPPTNVKFSLNFEGTIVYPPGDSWGH
ncbi:hypothetical protein NL676_026290 [Syzygium grande]|nr:hypothetical protein NL676_026290 [Syzygium grande]